MSISNDWIPVHKIINKVIEKNTEKNVRDNTHFHPSEWYGCKRKIAYKYHESTGHISLDVLTNTIDARLQRCFDNGHSVHHRWTNYVSQLKTLYGKWKCIVCSKEYGTDEKFGVLKPDKCVCDSSVFKYEENGFLDIETMMGGHVDAILGTEIELYGEKYKLEPDEDKIVIDYKSINPIQCQKLTQPLDGHNIQMQIYLFLTGLKSGRFIYENKGNQEVVEFKVIRDDKIIDEIKAEALKMKHIVTNKNSKGKWVLPPRPYTTRANYECKQCSFRGHCWA